LGHLILLILIGFFFDDFSLEADLLALSPVALYLCTLSCGLIGLCVRSAILWLSRILHAAHVASSIRSNAPLVSVQLTRMILVVILLILLAQLFELLVGKHALSLVADR